MTLHDVLRAAELAWPLAEHTVIKLGCDFDDILRVRTKEVLDAFGPNVGHEFADWCRKANINGGICACGDGYPLSCMIECNGETLCWVCALDADDGPEIEAKVSDALLKHALWQRTRRGIDHY